MGIITKDKKFQTDNGQVLITTLLVISSVTLVLITSLGVSSRAYLSSNQTLYYSIKVQTAAEGSMNETLEHVKKNPSWPGSNYSDSYTFEGINISRTIMIYDGSITYEISAEYKSIRRKLLATENLDTKIITFSTVSP